MTISSSNFSAEQTLTNQAKVEDAARRAVAMYKPGDWIGVEFAQRHHDGSTNVVLRRVVRAWSNYNGTVVEVSEPVAGAVKISANRIRPCC